MKQALSDISPRNIVFYAVASSIRNLRDLQNLCDDLVTLRFYLPYDNTFQAMKNEHILMKLGQYEFR